MLYLAGVGSSDTVDPFAGLNHMPGASGVAKPPDAWLVCNLMRK